MIVKGGALLNFGVNESTSASSKACYVPSSTFVEQNPNPSLKQLRDGIWQCKQAQVFKDESFDQYVERTSQFYVLKPDPSPLNNKTPSRLY